MAEELAVARLGLVRDEMAGQVAVVTGAGRGIGRALFVRPPGLPDR